MKKRIVNLLFVCIFAFTQITCGAEETTTETADNITSIVEEENQLSLEESKTDVSISSPEEDSPVSEEVETPAEVETSEEAEAPAEAEEVLEDTNVILSDNIDDYTIVDVDVEIANVIKETEYYYGPSEAFETYTDISGGVDMGHPMPGNILIIYGKCVETGWWRIDLGRSGDYPVLYVPEDCVEMP